MKNHRPLLPRRRMLWMIYPWMIWALIAGGLFSLIFAAKVSGGDNPATRLEFKTSSMTTQSVLDLTATRSLWIQVGSDRIVIDLRTGKVTLPKDMKLDDAAVAFWLRVAQCFPECRQAILTGDPTPKTIEWQHADHYTYAGGKAHELGLRSDGVVVWREVKP